jgi:hypothetical protein
MRRSDPDIIMVSIKTDTVKRQVGQSYIFHQSSMTWRCNALLHRISNCIMGYDTEAPTIGVRPCEKSCGTWKGLSPIAEDEPVARKSAAAWPTSGELGALMNTGLLRDLSHCLSSACLSQ